MTEFVDKIHAIVSSVKFYEIQTVPSIYYESIKVIPM